MFYSEQLLSKTGPLARVWLASNVERKLSKSDILRSDLQSSINAIVDQGQEPMALRLSGQLMLGVVRIFGRQCRYLLDDCNETLLKIRMTFKNTNNHDLPANALTTVELNLTDKLTIEDLFPAMDWSYGLTQQPILDGGDRMQDLDRDWTSTLNPQQSSQLRLTPDDQGPLVNDEDLDLDFGDRDDVDVNDTTVSVQYGRGSTTPRPIGAEIQEEDQLFNNDDDLQLDLGEDIAMGDEPVFPADDDQLALPDTSAGVGALDFGDDETLQLRQAATGAQERDETVHEQDRTFVQPEEEDEIEEAAAQQRQRSRKIKPLVADTETVLHNRQIKAQSENRSKILKPASFLPKDPILLTLMSMQKNGDFVANAMNDGRSKNWAPELQGLLSFEVVHRSGQLKRKRDSGIGGITEDEHNDKSPRLEVDDDDIMDEGVELGGLNDHSAFDLPADNGVQPIMSDGLALEDVIPGEDDEGIFAAEETFNDTTIPLLHPADSGPISLGTKRVVHLLRDQFGGESTDGSPSSQAKKSVLLQDLVPERTSTKEEATKMFFEVLVLATKDAIKVEQSDKSIGSPLRIRGKRGLWGSWAEATPGDENQSTQEPIAV